MLHTCTEVAVTAQRAITDPGIDVEGVIGRLADLLAIIDFHSADPGRLVAPAPPPALNGGSPGAR